MFKLLSLYILSSAACSDGVCGCDRGDEREVDTAAQSTAPKGAICLCLISQ